MPAIFELLYREFCRARLAEMRKQLLLTRKQPKQFLPDENPSDPDGMAPRHDTELKRARE